jgi:hypothetical protein
MAFHRCPKTSSSTAAELQDAGNTTTLAHCEHWGRLVETAVGAHLVATRDPRAEILYWRDRGGEVDFVIERGKQLTAIEVKSGRPRNGLPGMAAFEQAFGQVRKRLVGGDGTPLEAFLADAAAANA